MSTKRTRQLKVWLTEEEDDRLRRSLRSLESLTSFVSTAITAELDARAATPKPAAQAREHMPNPRNALRCLHCGRPKKDWGQPCV